MRWARRTRSGTTCMAADKAHTMTTMRVKVRVVGNTLVLDEDAQLPPEGARLEAELRLVADVPDGYEMDEETEEDLVQALKEADAGDFVSEEEVWADIEAARRK